MLNKICGEYFSRYDAIFIKNLFAVLEAMIECCSSNTANIIQQMCKQNGKQYSANDKALHRLLTNSMFQIDDSFWRCYLNFIFFMLKKGQIISKDKKIFLQVDFTSNKNDFLILCASILYKGRAIPLYFTMRLYPKKKGMLDQKKMELAFLKGLKHALSIKYQYVIVADRGFGNARFVENCEQLGFDYLIRLCSNKKIFFEGKSLALSDLSLFQGIKRIHVTSWERNVHILMSTLEGVKERWYLVTNLVDASAKELVEEYKNRFKIEKVFQDLKSSGFDMESSKIRKYDRYKRLFFLSAITHSIMVIVGAYIDENVPKLKKNSPLCLDILLAYSSLPKGLSLYISTKL